MAARATVAAVAALATVAPAAAETVRVEIKALVFTPAEMAVAAGDRVEWVNSDIVDHTATARDGSWEVVVPAGKTAGRTFAATGGADYYCRYHPNMTGRLAPRQ